MCYSLISFYPEVWKAVRIFFFTVSILEYKKTFFRKYKKLFWVWFFCLEKVPGRQKPTVIPTYKGYIKFFIFNLVSICVRVYKFFFAAAQHLSWSTRKFFRKYKNFFYVIFLFVFGLVSESAPDRCSFHYFN